MTSFMLRAGMVAASVISVSVGLGGGAALAQSPSGEAPSAEDLAKAEQFFNAGSELYDEGKYELALEAWRKSYDIVGHHDIQFSLSSAYERLARYQEAIDALDKYRVYADPGEAATLKAKRDSLYRRLEEQRAQAAIAPAPTVAPTVPTAPTATSSSDAKAEKPGGKRSPLPVVLIAAGGAGLATSGVFFAQAAGARASFSDLCADTDRGLLCPSEAQDDLGRYQSAGTVGTISAAAGGALVISGAILAATSKGGKSADFTVSPASDGQRHSLWLQGRFK